MGSTSGTEDRDGSGRGGREPLGRRFLFWTWRHTPQALQRDPSSRSLVGFVVGLWAVGVAIWTIVMFVIGGVPPRGLTDADWFSWAPSTVHAIESSVVFAVASAIGLSILIVPWSRRIASAGPDAEVTAPGEPTREGASEDR